MHSIVARRSSRVARRASTTRRVNARARVHATRRRRATRDARRTTRDDGMHSRAGRTDGRTGRTMTDGRSRRGSFHSFTSSRDDSIHMHSRAIRDARARCVCVHPCIHANARVSRVVFFFSRRVRASIGRTRRRARREVVESTPRVISFIHSFIRMNACHRMKNCVIDGTSRRDASMRTRRNGERKPPTTASRAFASVVVASRARGRWTTR